MTIKTVFLFLLLSGSAALTGLGQSSPLAPVVSAIRSPIPTLLWHASGIEVIGIKVVSVESGDMVTILRNGNKYPFKLIAIDAPDSGQPVFDKSREALSRLVKKKNVKVAMQAQYSDGLFVGTLYRDGRDVGLKLLETGMAWYRRLDGDRLTNTVKKTYLDAQTNAASAGVGIWAEDHPIPPWVYRGEELVREPEAVEPPMPSTNGHTYIRGRRGGCYYVGSRGRRVYARDKRLCGIRKPETSPIIGGETK